MPFLPGPQDDWAAWNEPPPLPARNASRWEAPPPLREHSPARPPAPLPPLPSAEQYPPARSVAPAGPRMPPAPVVPTRRGRRWGAARAVVALALIAVLVLGGLTLHRLGDFGAAISPRGAFTTQTGFLTGVDRMNLLVMGYGGAGHDGANLTDSMMVLSVVPSTGATTMISVPRDLWVQVPPNSGNYSKLNTAYQDGLGRGFSGYSAGRLAGGAEAAQKVSQVLGIPVHYWLTIDFQGFRSLVDALGGVDLNVPTAFTAKYPVNDDPAINASWKIISFATGMQHMDGERAIEYARARYVLQPASEGSDFARSARQQLLIRALLSRVHQSSAWPGLLNATTALQSTIYTNLSLTDLGLFSSKIDFTHAVRIGLSNSNVLVDATSSDGQDILLPVHGDWGSIQKYVTSHLK